MFSTRRPTRRTISAVVVVAGVVAAALGSGGCSKEGCLAGEEGCEVPSACTKLEFTCADTAVDLRIVSSADEVPGGLDSMGAVGDFLLVNSKVEAVIDAIDHPTDLAPTGGAILDLADRDRDDDAVNHIFQAVGALPSDAVVYTSQRVLKGDGLVAIQFEGHLQGDERQLVYTRYELRACEPGLRVRTEMVNGGDDTVVWSNADGVYWGGRSMLPFTPTVGEGYFHPSFGLSTLNDVFRTVPFVVGAGHSDPASGIAVVGCNVASIDGFESGQVSANGTARRIVTPSDYEVYERFIAVAPGSGAQPGVDIALQLRKQLFNEAFTTIGGVVELEGGRVGAVGTQHARASVQIYEGKRNDPRDSLIPWTEVLPRTDGTFSANVPSDRSYVVEVIAFGNTAAVFEKDVGEGALDLGTIRIPAAGDVTINVNVDGVADHAQVFVEPADDDTAELVAAKYFNVGPVCAPLLGNPFGPSPACNRVLVEGPTTIDIPPGHYNFFATAGLFASVQKRDVVVTPASSQAVNFSLAHVERLPGTLSGDFHVHGAKSFDSTIPDLDRVRAFLASGTDVIIATDHDAVWDYAQAMDALGARDRITLITGTETTPLRLFKLSNSVYFPQVIGHWIAWPLPFDNEGFHKGVPDDELVEPGALFTRLAANGYDAQDGVIQLNHPWAELEFGRDLGFSRAIGLRLKDANNAPQEIPHDFDGTGPSLFFHTPEGSSFSNADFHVQEVVNGTDAGQTLQYRALWLWQLQQGIVRAGTANSDSHSITDSVLGTPRNIVYTSTTHDNFDLATFDADVRAGHMIGTNGAVIELELRNGAAIFKPSTTAVVPVDGATVHVRVHALPWVPVREVRILVNGGGVVTADAASRTIVFSTDDDDGGGIDDPGDPEAAVDVVRFEKDFPLSELLPAGRKDAFIIVEAGNPLPAAGNLDCDGMPDTTDNNRDGVVDFKDVDRNGDGVADAKDIVDVTKAEKCAENYGANPDVTHPAIGPLKNPAAPARDDVSHPFYVVTPGAISYAFTNPILLDVNNDGAFTGSGL